jgi:hypothetical protein
MIQQSMDVILTPDTVGGKQYLFSASGNFKENALSAAGCPPARACAPSGGEGGLLAMSSAACIS